MDKDFIEKMGYFASVLSIVNHNLNQDALTNQDLAKMLDERVHDMLEELNDNLGVIQNQMDRIIIQNEIILKHL